MFPKSKYNKSTSGSLNYKSNLNISLQSSKYHPNIYSKKKSTINKNISFKSNNKFAQNRTWKKQASHNNWNKENDKNYLNYEQYNSKNDNNQYYYNPKEKRDNKSYYNKEYSYLYSYERKEGEKQKKSQKKEKKIQIDYATTQSNSSSHEECNNNQYNSNDKVENITVINENNYNSHDNEFKSLNTEEENNNENNININNFDNVNQINEELEEFNVLNFNSNTNIPSIIDNNNNITNINIENDNNQQFNNITDIINVNNDMLNMQIFPLNTISSPSPVMAQSKKPKKNKKNKKFSLSSKELDIKKSISNPIIDNNNSDFQPNNEPYNKFNSVNNELITPIINPIVENTEILQVNVKIAKDKNVMFKLRRFDDLFLTVKLFCEINSIEEKFMKPIITKALCTLNSIYQIYNTKLDQKNIKVLQMIKTFNSVTAI